MELSREFSSLTEPWNMCVPSRNRCKFHALSQPKKSIKRKRLLVERNGKSSQGKGVEYFWNDTDVKSWLIDEGTLLPSRQLEALKLRDNVHERSDPAWQGGRDSPSGANNATPWWKPWVTYSAAALPLSISESHGTTGS
ncbi:hypothetical protein J437_LFUL018665 [Ladona fulva]|uniref:Uncharacterized protein n=1 Tax=Ladona fulva TaxID=123851 RepID=A0A8K0PBP0_LADFU|nr:hypothetical protein J437_LFUL018665 [Ladona fulva]